MDSLQQQVLSLLSEDWKSRIEIVRETGASEHEVQVALNELQDQIETSYGSLAGLKKARMYRLKECTDLRTAHNHPPPIFNWINAAIPPGRKSHSSDPPASTDSPWSSNPAAVVSPADNDSSATAAQLESHPPAQHTAGGVQAGGGQTEFLVN